MPYLSGFRNCSCTGRRGSDSWPPSGLDDALDLANLGSAIDRKVKGYSQGMRQRLGIAQAVMHRPELLVLDEPTNGMDPAETRRMRLGLAELSSRGTTVLLSSHLLAEVEQVCSHVLVVDHGTLVAGGTVAEIIGAGQTVDLEVDDPVRAESVLCAGCRGSRRFAPRNGGSSSTSTVSAARRSSPRSSTQHRRRHGHSATAARRRVPVDRGGRHMIRVEWVRQTRRLRTWACLAGLAAVPIIFSIAAYVDPPRERRQLMSSPCSPRADSTWRSSRCSS